MSITARARETAKAAAGLWNRRQRQADYARTFRSPHGRRVLEHLMRCNGLLEQTAGVPDPAASLVKDGRRLAVLGILSHLRLDEKAVLTQVLEGNDDVVDDDVPVDIG